MRDNVWVLLLIIKKDKGGIAPYPHESPRWLEAFPIMAVYRKLARGNDSGSDNMVFL